MTAYGSSARRGDGRLWAVALGLSLLVNGGLFIAVGLAAVRSEIYRKERALVPKSAQAAASVVTIFPQAAKESQPVPVAPSEPEKTRFARTSPDQASSRPERPAFIGERDTEATSDRAPTNSNPALPSQKGENPKSADDLETTQSDYKDGKLAQSPPSPSSQVAPAPAPPAPMANLPPSEANTAGEKTEKPGTDDTKAASPPREKLLQGPNPVDVEVPKETSNADNLKPTPPKTPKEGSESKTTTKQASPKPQQMPRDPAFSGFQRKAAITGSISRTGRSALAVADSPLGRYQAIISRAVEQEWQRNCVRHRDFITPGFLTVRFFVETSGRVRTVQFVGEMETGEVQKGFTLNSIRDAEIPPMPQGLKQEYAKEPLELIFNFYF